MGSNDKPKARQNNIVIHLLKDELLIYDLTMHKAYCLNETSALVWNLCDGDNSVSDISKMLSKKLKSTVTEDFVWLALNDLKKENLLAGGQEIANKLDRLSRREVIRRVGFASMLALPVISSLIAPAAAVAQSCGTVGQSCSPPNSLGDCCSGTAYCGGTSVCQACIAPSNSTGCRATAAQCATLGYICCSGTMTSTPDPAGCGAGVRCVCA